MVKKLFINEATLNDNLLKQVGEAIENAVMSVEDNIAVTVASKVKSFDPDWVADQPSQKVDKAREAYIQAIMNDLFANFNI